MRLVLRILLIVFLLSCPVQLVSAAEMPAGPGDVQSLVAKIIAAGGGRKVIEGMTSVHAVGDIEALMRQDRGSYELFLKRPRKLRVDTRYQQSSETRILSNRSGYRRTDDAPFSPVKDYRLLAMVYQYKHLDLLYGLLQGEYSISVKGKEDLNGKLVEVMHLTDAEGPPMDVYVDGKTFFIVKVTGYFEVAGKTTTLSSEYSDFRKVGNTVFPFKVVSYAGGEKIAETIMKSYSINPEIPDSLFTP